MTVTIGSQWYLSPWWIEVIGFTRKSRFVRYRKLSRGKAPVERLSMARFLRTGRPA